ncbi:hypothetical protein D3C85_1723760 [compost metagenome]
MQPIGVGDRDQAQLPFVLGVLQVIPGGRRRPAILGECRSVVFDAGRHDTYAHCVRAIHVSERIQLVAVFRGA